MTGGGNKRRREGGRTRGQAGEEVEDGLEAGGEAGVAPGAEVPEVGIQRGDESVPVRRPAGALGKSGWKDSFITTTKRYFDGRKTYWQ